MHVSLNQEYGMKEEEGGPKSHNFKAVITGQYKKYLKSSNESF